MTKFIYHIFSHETDEYSTDRKEAMAIYNEYRQDYGCARLYLEEHDENNDIISENCILSHGEYPM